MTQLSRRRLLATGLAAGLAPALAPAVERGRRVTQPVTQSGGQAQDARPGLPGRTQRTRFAVNVEMWWPGLPLEDRIRNAAALGFPAVELWGLGGRDVPVLAALVRELGIEVGQFTAWGFSPGLNDPAQHSAFVDAVGTACEQARLLGARCATVVAGNDRPGVSREAMHEQVIAGLRLAAPVAEAGGLVLILEPMNGRVDHPGHCLYGSEAGVRICRAVGSPRVKLNWDLYHAQIAEGDLCGHLREGFDQLGYAQLADHPGRHEPGTGEIHYPRVLRELHELGYRGCVGLECSPLEGEARAAERVAAADRW